jgi:type IX secretion system PorP/SprF family membrane protein
MKRVALIVLVVMFPLLSFSQQDPQLSQYLFNGVVINPAYAGSKENINLNALYRKQWVQVNGSPTSQLISVDAPLFNNHMGIGGYAYNDEAGAQFQKAVFGSFSYRIKVSSKGRLALGVSAGINQVGLDGSKLTTDQANDPAIPQSRVSKVKPDMQAGLYYNTHRFFAGVSLADIITNNFNKTLVVSERRHFYVASGFVSTLSQSFKLRPSILIKEDFKGPTNADLTAFLIYKDRFWFGSSYRTRVLKKGNDNENTYSKDALVFMVQIFPLENLRIGYGYDLSLTDYKNYATHEFSLGYMLYGKKGSKMLSPRYF